MAGHWTYPGQGAPVWVEDEPAAAPAEPAATTPAAPEEPAATPATPATTTTASGAVIPADAAGHVGGSTSPTADNTIKDTESTPGAQPSNSGNPLPWYEQGAGDLAQFVRDPLGKSADALGIKAPDINTHPTADQVAAADAASNTFTPKEPAGGKKPPKDMPTGTNEGTTKTPQAHTAVTPKAPSSTFVPAKIPEAAKLPTAPDKGASTAETMPGQPKAPTVASATQGNLADIADVKAPKGPAGVGNVANIATTNTQTAGAEASYGKNAAQGVDKSFDAAKKMAQEEANLAASGAAAQSVAAARAAGMSPAQAALAAQQQVGTTYNAAMGENIKTGMAQYAQLAEQQGQLGTTEAGLKLQKYKDDLDQALGKGQISQAEYATRMQQYQTDVQAELTQRGQDVQQNANKVQEKLGLGQLDQAQFATKMQGYGIDSNRITAEMANDITKYGMDITKWSQQAQNALQQQQIATNAALTAKAQELQNKGIDMSGYTAQLAQIASMYASDKGFSAAQMQNNANIFQNAMGAIMGAAGAAATVFSDKNLKTNIRDGWGVLDAVTKSVAPKVFKYKQGVADGGNHVGIMAQDLEKTPLAGAVKDTPQGKTVDTGQLTTGNTAMILDLNKKLDAVMKHIKGGR